MQLDVKWEWTCRILPIPYSGRGKAVPRLEGASEDDTRILGAALLYCCVCARRDRQYALQSVRRDRPPPCPGPYPGASDATIARPIPTRQAFFDSRRVAPECPCRGRCVAVAHHVKNYEPGFLICQQVFSLFSTWAFWVRFGACCSTP